ncbi:MAG TPA: hypothetical protein VNV65_02380 [Candidatus Solibacter sp.]|jgi:hypothetical protein|nr:hypothetical protein [Candidatus Solibacter sp.]
MNASVIKVLKKAEINPVLVDVGASGEPPRVWSPIASQSIYLGFDPDLRAMSTTTNGRYQKSVIINSAVTVDPLAAELKFYLTRSPYCSSTLPPDNESLSSYLFADLFEVERQATVPAVTVTKAAELAGLAHLDWLKTDSQGTDLRIFESVSDEVRQGVLAVDIEPGLIDAYVGEDLFVDAHRAMIREGFWLARLEVHGAARIATETAGRFIDDTGIHRRVLEAALRPSPGWVEARYLRTAAALEGRSQREHVLLWVFAMLDTQPGFALEISEAYAERIGRDALCTAMYECARREIGSAARRQLPGKLAGAAIRRVRRVMR